MSYLPCVVFVICRHLSLHVVQMCICRLCCVYDCSQSRCCFVMLHSSSLIFLHASSVLCWNLPQHTASNFYRLWAKIAFTLASRILLTTLLNLNPIWTKLGTFLYEDCHFPCMDFDHFWNNRYESVCQCIDRWKISKSVQEVFRSQKAKIVVIFGGMLAWRMQLKRYNFRQ